MINKKLTEIHRPLFAHFGVKISVFAQKLLKTGKFLKFNSYNKTIRIELINMMTFMWIYY